MRSEAACACTGVRLVFFDGLHGVLRVIVVGISAYAYLVLLLRVCGKRTLAELDAFDFLVTVALGSTLSSVLVSSGVALVEGMVALTLLAALRYAVAWVSSGLGSVPPGPGTTMRGGEAW